MATVYWRGDSPAIAQVDTLTPGGTIEVGDKFKVTINGKTVSYSATGTTVASVCTGLVAALQASTVPAEFNEITWADNTTAVTATNKVAGRPHTISITTTESDDGAADLQTFVKTATTANSGPNNWDVATNWSGGAVPVNSDDVYIETPISILYGLAQSAVTLTSLTISAKFTANLGLAVYNSNGYYEYRDTYLAIGATTITIGAGSGACSGFIRINTGSVQTTLIVHGTGANVELGAEPVRFKGTHASNLVDVRKGVVGIASHGGDTATVANLHVGYVNDRSNDATVVCGSGVTLTTISKSGGTLTTQSNCTTYTQTFGTGHMLAGTCTTLNVYGGQVNYQSTGTITTLNITDNATINFGLDTRTRTVTNCYRRKNSVILDPNQTVTFTNGVSLTPVPSAPAYLGVTP